MRLCRVKIRNFRCYKAEVTIDLDQFVALIGKNDVGKSAIFDALALFFDQQKPDGDDATRDGNKADMAITCEFDQLPATILIDAQHRTTLDEEYLLNTDGHLEIVRIFNGALKSPTPRTSIHALHPTAPLAADLLGLKIPELRSRARHLEVDLSAVNQTVSAELRRAIRAHIADLAIGPVEIEVDDQPGAKELYARIREALPAFFLFRADRASTDQDSEAQDPMKIAVRLAIENQKESLQAIALKVQEQVSELVDGTLVKVAAMAPEIAAELTPEISEPRWESIFKIALNSDADIPLNKRGSGVRRLVLLAFLQAQAEARQTRNPECGIIYAIEEPETSQHPDRQRSLLHALEQVAAQRGCQALITTHVPTLARLLPGTCLRYIGNTDGARTVSPPGEETMKLVVAALGVLPDHDVNVFVGVEGKHDESFLKAISTTLAATDVSIGSLTALEDAGKLIFIPVGGSNAGLWVSRLQGLNRPEFHIFDRDASPPQEPHYASEADRINQRSDCMAVHTSKRALENYLHVDAIAAARPDVSIPSLGEFDDVPALVARNVHEKSESGTPWDSLDADVRARKASRAKAWLNTEAAAAMTPEMLGASDPSGDITGWLREITGLARTS